MAFEATLVFAGDSDPIHIVREWTPFELQSNGDIALGIVRTEDDGIVSANLSGVFAGRQMPLLTAEGTRFLFGDFAGGQVSDSGFRFVRNFTSRENLNRLWSR